MIFKEGKERVLCIPDTHSPFMHKDAVVFLKTVSEKYKPTTIIHLGDEYDAHAVSDYSHDPDGYSAGHELNKAIEQLQGLYTLFPKVNVCHSNHTTRPFKRAFKTGLPAKFLRDIKEVLEAPIAWNWQDRWIIDGIVYEHGESYVGEKAHMLHAKANMKSTVIGHTHAFAGIQYLSNPYEQFFGMNCGCLIDESAYAFAYSKNMKNKPVLGCGIIDKGIPMYVPMLQDKYNRWIGKL